MTPDFDFFEWSTKRQLERLRDDVDRMRKDIARLSERNARLEGLLEGYTVAMQLKSAAQTAIAA